MENYFVDICAVVIILICGTVGYKKGILSGIITIVSSVISVIGAKLLTPYAAPYAGKVIAPIIEKMVVSNPEKYIEKYVSGEHMSSFLDIALEKSLDAAHLLSEELTLLTQELVAFFVLFVIIILLSNKVLRFVSLNFPLIKTVNRFAGMLFGAFVGLVLIVILFSSATKYIVSSENYVSLLPYFENSLVSQIFFDKL